MRPILLVLFLDVLAYSMLAPLLPTVLRTLAGADTPTAWLAGVLGACYAGMQLLSGPLVGILSDRYGRRPVLLACQAGTLLAFVLLANAWSVEVLFAAVLIDGLTGGNQTTAHAAIADLSSEEKRAHHLALAGAAFGLGATIGPALGALLATIGASIPIAACVIAAASLAITCIRVPESRPTRSTAAVTTHVLRQQPKVLLLLAAIFSANLSFVGLQANFSIFSADRFSWTMRETSAFFACIGICAVFTQGLLLPRVQRRLHERTLVLGGLPLLAAGLLGVALTPDPRGLFAAAAAAALGSGLALPTLSAVAVSAAEEQRGLLMGATQSLHAIASILAPLSAGAAYEFIGTGAPYLIGSACALVAAGIAACALHSSFAKTTHP